MYPLISLIMAAERARDLQNEAAMAHLRKEARRARRAQRAARARRASGIVPDTYEDFLCQTARSATREPTATGRASGQAVH
jgi:hypothetical protein